MPLRRVQSLLTEFRCPRWLNSDYREKNRQFASKQLFSCVLFPQSKFANPKLLDAEIRPRRHLRWNCRADLLRSLMCITNSKFVACSPAISRIGAFQNLSGNQPRAGSRHRSRLPRTCDRPYRSTPLRLGAGNRYAPARSTMGFPLQGCDAPTPP